MSELTPKNAALLAKEVYNVKNEAVWERYLKQLTLSSNPNLAGFQNNPSRGEGLSGWGKKTGFVYMAQNSTNEHVVAIRGTDSLADWVTDARVSYARSPSGFLVHRGFSLAFESIKPSIDSYFEKVSPGSPVHVVGHSLGGALACLTGEYLKNLGHGGVKLYTFGCPRVGDTMYSKFLDRPESIGVINIHRVYHDADPVSMIPLYPFSPVSNSITGHQLPWNGLSISFFAHKMDNYISSVGESSWASLPKANNFDFFPAMNVWLEQVGSGGGQITMMSSSCLRQILKGLQWILSSIGSVSAAAAQFIASGAAIVVDVMAFLLYQGVLMAKEIGSHVKYILSAILRFLGRTLDTSINITIQFIKFVLDMFFRVISNAANRALYLGS